MSDAKEILLRSTDPLKKVVMAAIMDTHEDVGRVEHSFTHWGARGLKKLEQESLRTTKFKVLLTVNKNTRSATLPPGFDYETFVGVIYKGKKIQIYPSNKLADVKHIEDIPCEDRCEKCNQDKAICQDLSVTEDTTIVEVNGQTAQLTVIKKLYPDGRYYLETITPVWDVDSETIEYRTTKEFITELDLKPCGCIDETDENIDKIKTCCPEVWACHFAQCDTSCTINLGGYQIYEESGMIYFDRPVFNKVYIEGHSFLPKINGQYRVPKVAFETLVEWIVWKNMQNKRNVTRQDKDAQYQIFRNTRGDMEHVQGRVSLGLIFKYVESIPKFDLDHDYIDFCDITKTGIDDLVNSFAAISSSGSGSGSDSGNDSDGCVSDDEIASCCPASAKGYQPFQIAVIAGLGTGTPTVGVNYFQLDILKNAVNLNLIFVNNTPENTKNQQFTFDPVSGTIYRWQGDGVTENNWEDGDTLIADFSKYIE